MLRQKDDCDFEASMGYRVRFCLVHFQGYSLSPEWVTWDKWPTWL